MPGLRIALLLGTPGKSWGGMEQHTLDLAQSLASRDYNVHLLAHPEFRPRMTPPLIFHPLPMNLGRRNPWLRHRIAKILRDLQPDICHAQGNKAAALLSHSRRSLQGGLYVGTVHGIKSSHQAFNRLDGVIAVSQTILASIAHPHKVCIYNGIADRSEVKIQTDVRSKTEPDRWPLVVAIGRLEPVKGFDTLLRAWHHANQPGNLVIIGSGSQEAPLKTLRERLGLESTVSFAGHRTDVAQWLARADVCVISSHREGFPYVLIEALQAACPVLATPVGGPAELLPANSLSTDHSSYALAALLQKQLADLPALRESQRAIAEFARSNLTLAAMTNQTEAFYRSLSPVE